MKSHGSDRLEPLINAVKGAIIGAANTIPGVSGGTLAVVTGIYDRLVRAVGYFFRGPGGWRGNLRFLLPVGAGVIVGVLAFARVMDFFLGRYPDGTAFFFMGLILGSLPFIVKTGFTGRVRPVHVVPFLVTFGVLVAAAMAGRPPQPAPITVVTPTAAVVLFAAGVLSAATMVVPGVSGSFVLLVIGLYPTVIAAARNLDVAVLSVFGAGVAVGIVGIARLIAFLLSRFRSTTYAAIVGLVAGSVVTLWPGRPTGIGVALVDVVLFAGGFALAYYLGAGSSAGPVPDTETGAAPDTETGPGGGEQSSL
ncbi:MAG: DUF368 domain-containing protein [Spirochaetaceae bacterium]